MTGYFCPSHIQHRVAGQELGFSPVQTDASLLDVT